MNRYRALPLDKLTSDEYTLVPIREADMASIRIWRNEQIDVLRQSAPLSEDDQSAYYREHVVPSFTASEPKIMLFSLLQNDGCIGYGGLTNIDWVNRRAEVSFLVRTDRAENSVQYRLDFAHFLRMLKDVAFLHLRLNRLFTETYDIRPDHLSVLEESGFRFEGRLRSHVLVQGRTVDSLIHGCLRNKADA